MHPVQPARPHLVYSPFLYQVRVHGGKVWPQSEAERLEIGHWKLIFKNQCRVIQRIHSHIPTHTHTSLPLWHIISRDTLPFLARFIACAWYFSVTHDDVMSLYIEAWRAIIMLIPDLLSDTRQRPVVVAIIRRIFHEDYQMSFVCSEGKTHAETANVQMTTTRLLYICRPIMCTV